MTHAYISTACQHTICPMGGLSPEESMCIRSCKYCDAPCQCPCHEGRQDSTGRLRDVLRTALLDVWDSAVTVDDITTVVLEALTGMPKSAPELAVKRLEKWLESEEGEEFRSKRLGIDLRTLINEYRALKDQ